MTVHPAPAPLHPVVTVPLTGQDLDGWSALPLLGETGTDKPWLFLLRTGAVLSTAPLAHAAFGPIDLPLSGLPFETDSLGGVVIDGESVSGGEEAARTILAEARRCTGRTPNVLVACRHRYIGRHLTSWREHGRPTVTRWQRAASKIGAAAGPIALLEMNGQRITEIRTPTESSGRGTGFAGSDRVVLRVGPHPPGATGLAGLVRTAAEAAGLGLTLQTAQVRKIGKTSLFAAGEDGRRYVVRVPRSPIAQSRGARNFHTLEQIGRSGLPARMKVRAPRAIAAGSCDGYHFFVESAVDGRPGQDGESLTAALQEAGAFITELHTATRQSQLLDGRTLDELVAAPIVRIAGAIGQRDGAARVLDGLRTACERALHGRDLPLVLAHGDYTAANCLFDRTGQLTGVVDWEVSNGRGLPLLDLLQLMPVGDDHAGEGRWRRFDAWMTFVDDPARVASHPLLGPYSAALDLRPDVIPALVMLHWATHVADRVAARAEDQRWMRLRVWQPLESLERRLCN